MLLVALTMLTDFLFRIICAYFNLASTFYFYKPKFYYFVWFFLVVILVLCTHKLFKSQIEKWNVKEIKTYLAITLILFILLITVSKFKYNYFFDNPIIEYEDCSKDSVLQISNVILKKGKLVVDQNRNWLHHNLNWKNPLMLYSYCTDLELYLKILSVYKNQKLPIELKINISSKCDSISGYALSYKSMGSIINKIILYDCNFGSKDIDTKKRILLHYQNSSLISMDYYIQEEDDSNWFTLSVFNTFLNFLFIIFILIRFSLWILKRMVNPLSP